MKTNLYTYQKTAADDIYRKMSTTDQRGAYLGFDTGCVCGNNRVTVKLNGTECSQVMTVKNLYERWKKGEKFTIKSLVNGHFQFMPIKDVIYSGIKKCITIHTDCDRIQHGIMCHLSCTYDHPILCEKGFKKAENFKVGDYIFSNGQLVCSYCGKKLSNTPWRKYNKYPDLCKNCAHHMTSKEATEGYYEYMDKDGYIWVVDDNLRCYSEYRGYLPCEKQHSFYRRGIAKHRLIMMQHLGRDLKPNEVVHHIDLNKSNNDISNLQLMTQSEHAKIHKHTVMQHLPQFDPDIECYTTKNGKKYYFIPRKAKITKIVPIGEKPVYDISIDDKEIHNFVCSDKIVHNTGKTVTSLSVAEKLYKNHMIKGVVVICPVSKVDDWKRDLEYEVPEIEMKFVSSFQSAWREKNKAKIEFVCKMVDALVIVDEGHKMKTYDSKQSKFIQSLSETYQPYMLVLSATPQNKKYIDLYPQYKALGHPLFNIKPKDFKQRFCIEAQNWNLVRAGKARFPFNEIVGYRETEKMDKAIKDYTYYKKYESKYDRPIEIPQLFKMTSDMKYFKEKRVWPRIDEKALLRALEGGDDKLLDDGIIVANRPTLYHIYMRESCSGFIFNKYLKDNPKLQWLEDFLDGNEGRIVVFTNFVVETYIIKALCDKQKRHCVIYDGAHKDLKDWYGQDDCVAIVNVVAGGAGINDFAKTNIAIFFSPPENHIDFEQAKGRIDRIGQTKQPVYYYLQVMNSVEPAIYRNLKDGKDFDDRMFEEWLEKEG